MYKSVKAAITAITNDTMWKIGALVMMAMVVLQAKMENFGQAWSLLNSQ